MRLQLNSQGLENARPKGLQMLGPITTEPLRLPNGVSVAVPKTTPVFKAWRGPPIASTYGGKAVLEFKGEPAFAELIILWTLRQSGWQGAWLTHAGRREIYRDGLMHLPPVGRLPSALNTLLGDLRTIRGTSKGTWDVCCARGSSFLFAESKRKGHDRLSRDQLDWLEVALSLGLPVEAFIVVEWTSDVPLPLATRSRTRAGRASERHANTQRVPQRTSTGEALRGDDVFVFPSYEPGGAGRFRTWRQENPDAFLLNVRTSGDAVLHFAGCYTLNEPWPDDVPRPNTKIGADSLASLHRLAGESGWHTRNCGYCSRQLTNSENSPR